MQRQDFEPMLAFAEQMRLESPVYRDMALDRAKLLALGERMVAEPERVCGLVAWSWGQIVGLMVGFVSEPYFGPGCLASDLALFVPENVRGGLIAAALIRRFEAWAQARGASEVQLGITTGVHHDRTAALYARLGFAPFGVVCRKSTAGGA